MKNCEVHRQLPELLLALAQCFTQKSVNLMTFSLQKNYIYIYIKKNKKSKNLKKYDSWTDHAPTGLPQPTPQHKRLHFLSVACCHGYRVKQHYCKADPGELQLLSMDNWSALNRMQWSATTNKGNVKKSLICFFMWVSVGQKHWRHKEMHNFNMPVIVFLYAVKAPHLSDATPVTGFLRAGTAALWRWSNPPGRTAGTQRWVSRRVPASSTAASVRGARKGSRGDPASGSLSPPAPAPHGCSYLGRVHAP